MPQIIPIKDLKNTSEISDMCHKAEEPIYITKNGYNDLVLLSNEAYEQYEEKRIEDLINKHFNEKLDDFESFKKDSENTFILVFAIFFKFCVSEKLAISGRFITPSVVAYCGAEILVGNSALSANTDISNVLYGVLTLF